MAIEVSSSSAICGRCGTAYGNRKQAFPTSYADLYKGNGYIPICRKCVDDIYKKYLAECKDQRAAVKQVCRKLDLYFNDSLYDSAVKKSASGSLISKYMQSLNNQKYAGLSYDDTLRSEGTLWTFVADTVQRKDSEYEPIEVTDDIVAFWGDGYSKEMYQRLEQRRRYYAKKFPDAFPQDENVEDIGSDILMRQICILEVSIANDTASGKSVEKSVNSLNTLIGSLNLKPAQKEKTVDNSDDKTPFGVWIRRFENERPIPEPDPELKDVDGIKRFVDTWLYGHLAAMLCKDKPNVYSKMYEEEMERLRVENPELSDEDDEDLIYDVLSNDEPDETQDESTDDFQIDDYEDGGGL